MNPTPRRPCDDELGFKLIVSKADTVFATDVGIYCISARPIYTKLMSSFFSSDLGLAKAMNAKHWRALRLLDKVYDTRAQATRRMRKIRQDAERHGPMRVLVLGVEVPSRVSDIHEVVARLCLGSRHEVTTSIVPMGNKGKFANIDDAIVRAGRPLSSHDWMVIVDDDIAFDPGLLDDLIAVAMQANFCLAQPAHAHASNANYEITQRRFGALARQTRFVEIGPLTLVRSDLFADLVPFPASRWCYGIDLLWSEIVRRRGCKMGVVDAVAVRHLRPAGNSYDAKAACAEGQALLDRHKIEITREELFGLNERVV